MLQKIKGRECIHCKVMQKYAFQFTDKLHRKFEVAILSQISSESLLFTK